MVFDTKKQKVANYFWPVFETCHMCKTHGFKFQGQKVSGWKAQDLQKIAEICV